MSDGDPTSPDDSTRPAVPAVGDLWETHAQWWQEEFTEGADPEYEEQILPLAESLLSGYDRVLDVGTGEGQVARRIAAATGVVIGVDPTRNQVDEAARRAGGPVYGVAEAGGLPFRDDSFDAAVACLVFEHIDPLEPAVAEAARVLRPGGRFAFFLNHPLLQTPGSGWIDDHVLDPPDQYWRIGDYLVETSVVEEVRKDVFIPFVHRPLHRYVNALAEHGLLVCEMLEPAPPPGFLERSPYYLDAAAIPRLLVLVCELHSAT